MGSVYRTIEHSQLPAFLPPQPKAFLSVQASIPRQTKDDVNINMQLLFKQPDALPQGSTVTIRLPSGYDLNPSAATSGRIDPTVTFPQFKKSGGGVLGVTISGDRRSATTEAIEAFPAAGVFQVVLQGLKTPNQVQQSDFSISSSLNSNVINR